MNTVLTSNGRVVKKATEKYELLNVIFANDGTMYSFDYKTKEDNQEVTTSFTYFSNFKEKDKTDKRAVPGYYNSYFHSAYMINYTTFDDFAENYFSSILLEDADKGDIIEVSILHPINFNQYYTNRIYKFKIFETSKLYNRIADFPIINNDENSENYSTITDQYVDRSAHFTSYFYEKNFSDKLQLSEWEQLPNGMAELEILAIDSSLLGLLPTKVKFAKITTYICWKISQIVKHALPKLAIESIDDIRDAYLQHKNNNSISFNNLSQVDKLIAELIYSWGLLLHNHFETMPAIMGQTPDLREHLSYFSSLNHFYDSLAYYEETDLFPPISDASEDSQRRIRYLLNLNDSAFSILPPEERKDILDIYVKRSSLTEAEQRIVVKLVNSFNTITDADYLLNYLLQSNGLATNFEKLYEKLDDARLERYAIINWFADGQTNKKFFVFLVYEMWKVSNFNPLYIPVGVITNDIVNPNCFFYQTGTAGGDKYIAKYTNDGKLLSGSDGYLEFDSNIELFEDVLNEQISFTTVNGTNIKLIPKINNEQVFINKTKITSTTFYSDLGPFNSEDKEIIETYKFHLYQPVYPTAYVHDWELRIPQATIPAFLFLYSDDFKRIKEIDTALNLALEVTIEIGLFFIFGGANTFRHISHYRHFTKLKNSYRVGNVFHLPPGVAQAEIAISFRFEGAVTELLSITFANLGSLLNYYVQHESNQEKQELAKEISFCFMLLSLSTGLMSGRARYKATTMADEIVTRPLFASLPDDIKSILLTINSNNVNKLTNFQTALNNVTFSNGSNVLADFFSNIVGQEKKMLFYREFEKYFTLNADNTLTFLPEFTELNNLTVLTRWKDMQLLNIPFRSNLSIITNASRSNGLLRLYPYSDIRRVLENLTENELFWFIDRYGHFDEDFITKISLNSNAIKLFLATRSRPSAAWHLMTEYDVVKFVRDNNNPFHTGFLLELQKPINWKLLETNYRKATQIIEVPKIEVNVFNQRFLNGIPTDNSSISRFIRGLYKRSNRMFLKNIDIYNGSTLVENINVSHNINFISGNLEDVDQFLLGPNSILSNSFKNSFVNNLNINSVNIDPNKAYQYFSNNAWDAINLRPRNNDTEIKFIDWLFRTQWHKGNKFVIELESVLFTCPSCQRHLMMLVEYGRINGKSIKIKTYANSKILTRGNLPSN